MRARIGYVCPPPLPLQERGEAWAERPTATSFVCSSRCSAFALDMYIYIKTLNQTSRTVSTTLPAQAQPPFARHVIAIEHFIYPYLVKVVYMNLEKKKNPYFPPLFKSESGSKLWVIFLVLFFFFLFCCENFSRAQPIQQAGVVPLLLISTPNSYLFRIKKTLEML